jgi:hypothetical protein
VVLYYSPRTVPKTQMNAEKLLQPRAILAIDPEDGGFLVTYECGHALCGPHAVLTSEPSASRKH